MLLPDLAIQLSKNSEGFEFCPLLTSLKIGPFSGWSRKYIFDENSSKAKNIEINYKN
jgi:hypothetical protein